MLDLNDGRFENYLKEFRPLAPDPLPLDASDPASRRHFGFTIWVAGVAAMLILGVAGIRIVNHRVMSDFGQAAVRLPPVAPLTVRDANALLATAPSYKAVMNELAFPGKSSPVPKDKQSALAVLGKEKIRL